MDAGTIESAIIMRDMDSAVIAKVEASLAGLSGSVAKTSASVSASADRMAAAMSKRLGTVGKGMKDTGESLGKAFTLPLGAAAAAGLYFARDFGKHMTMVETLVGVNRQTVDQWRKDIIAMSGEVGRAPAELAHALFVVTSAGERGAKALDIVRESAKASAIGLGDTAVIARSVTGAMQAYRKSGLDAATATRTMIATVQEGNLEAADLAGSLGRVMGVASQVGVTFQEVGAFIATFTRVGISAEESVTALRGLMSTLIKPSVGAREALESVGLSIEQLRRNVQEKGLTAALIEMYNAFGGNLDTMGMVIENVRALAGFLSTAGSQADTFSQIIKNVNDISVDAEATEKRFQRSTETLGHAFETAKANIEKAAIALGERLAPNVRHLLENAKPLSDALVGMVAAFTRLPAPVQTAGLAFAGILTVIGPILMLTGKMISTFGGLVGKLPALGSALAKVAVDLQAVSTGAMGLGTALVGTQVAVAAFVAAFAVGGLILFRRELDATVKRMGLAFDELERRSKALREASVLGGKTFTDADEALRFLEGYNAALKKTTPNIKTLTEITQQMHAAMAAGDLTKVEALQQQLRGTVGLVAGYRAGLSVTRPDMLKFGAAVTITADEVKRANTHQKTYNETLNRLPQVSIKGVANEFKAVAQATKAAADANDGLVGNLREAQKALANAPEALLAQIRAGDTLGMEADDIQKALGRVNEAWKNFPMAAVRLYVDQLRNAKDATAAAADAMPKAAAALRDMATALASFDKVGEAATLLAVFLRSGLRLDQLPVDQLVRLQEALAAAIDVLARRGDVVPQAFIEWEQAARDATVSLDVLYGVIQRMGGLDPLPLAEAVHATAVSFKELYPVLEQMGGLNLGDVLPKPKAWDWGAAFKGAFGGIKTFSQSLAGAVVGAFQGGGDVAKSLGSSLGGMFGGMGTELFANASKVLGGMAGKVFGVIGGALGPLGSVLGGMVGGLFGKLFGGEAKKTKKMRQEWLASAGGLEKVQEMAEYAGYSLNKLLSTKKTKTFEAEVKRLEAAFKAAQERVAKLQEEVGKAMDAGAILSRDLWQRLLKDKDKDEIRKTLEEVFKASVARAAQGFNKIAGSMLGWLTKLPTDKLKALNEQIAKAIEQGKAGTFAPEFLAALPGGLKRVGVLAEAAFGALLAGGKTVAEALAELEPGLGEIERLTKATGVSAQGFLAELMGWRAVVSNNAAIFESLSGVSDMLVGLQNAGLLTQETFDELAGIVTESFAGLTAQGVSATDAMRLMQPQLQQLWALSDQWGLTLDENTAKLIAEAEAAGLVGEQFKPASERMVDALNALIGRFDVLLKAIGIDLPQAADDGLRQVQDRFDRTKPVVRYRFEPENELAVEPGGVPLGGSFARGTRGFVDFGKGTLAMLHGREAVVPEEAVQQIGRGGVAAMVGGLAGAAAAPAGGPDTLTVPLVVDGETLAEVVMRRLPGRVWAYGVR